MFTEKYACLYNSIQKKLEESCKFKPVISGEGEYLWKLIWFSYSVLFCVNNEDNFTSEYSFLSILFSWFMLMHLKEPYVMWNVTAGHNIMLSVTKCSDKDEYWYQWEEYVVE